MSRAGDTVNAANRARQSAVEQAQKATEKIRDMNEDRLLAKAAEIEARREKEEQKAFESTGDEDNTEAGSRPSRRGLRFRRDEKGLWAPRLGGMNDMTIAPGPGIPDGAVIAADLAERFAKSSTPGGQGVNTTDGKVQLSIDVAECASLTDAQRHRISRNLEHRLDGSVFTVTASTQRSVFR